MGASGFHYTPIKKGHVWNARHSSYVATTIVWKELGDLPKSRTHFPCSSANGLVLRSGYSALLPKDTAMLIPVPKKHMQIEQTKRLPKPARMEGEDMVCNKTLSSSRIMYSK